MNKQVRYRNVGLFPELKNFDKYFLGFQDSVLRLTIAQLNVIFVDCGSHTFSLFSTLEILSELETLSIKTLSLNHLNHILLCMYYS